MRFPSIVPCTYAPCYFPSRCPRDAIFSYGIKFVPGTDDQVVVALKSEEIEAEGSQTTFIMVFTLDGEVLLDETEVRSILASLPGAVVRQELWEYVMVVLLLPLLFVVCCLLLVVVVVVVVVVTVVAPLIAALCHFSAAVTLNLVLCSTHITVGVSCSP